MDLAGARWVGVDGCPAGWLALGQRDDGSWGFGCFASARELFARTADAQLVALDMPIGLVTHGVRDSEAAARQRLGPRSSCVFNAPARACLAPGLDYAQASQASFEVSGRKLSKQSFALLPKIAELDACLHADPLLASRVWEVHPELSFAVWTQDRSLRHSKHSGFGFAVRLAHVDARWPGAAQAVREAFSGDQVSDDDILDAFAALWSALRIAQGEAIAFGNPAARDAHGLRMAIHA